MWFLENLREITIWDGFKHFSVDLPAEIAICHGTKAVEVIVHVCPELTNRPGRMALVAVLSLESQPVKQI